MQDNSHGWSEDSQIKTQAGKEWYYEQIAIASKMGDVKYKMLIAELANYKHETFDEACDRFSDNTGEDT